MKRPTLGTSDQGPVRIDLERLVASRMLLTASSGGGKSWALRRILEQLHGQVQELVLDPEGEFPSLRAKLDYVLVGRGGDLPADPRTAAVLARRLLELGASAVLDLSELSMARPTRGQEAPRVAFVRSFLEGLLAAPRALWHPALVVLDEAHLFAPEKGSAESAAAVVDLMSRGRKRGYAGLLATQRLSKLAKDAAAEAQNVLVGRFTLDLDRKRAAEVLGFGGRGDLDRIRRLRPGHFYTFGPALSEDVVRVQVGAVRTPHPKAGDRGAAPPPPPAKVREALADLADLAAEAEEEARTLEDYQAKIQELERRLRQAESGRPAADPDALERARAQGRAEAAQEAARELVAADRARADAIAQHERIMASVARPLEAAQLELQKAADAVRTPLDVELPARRPEARAARPASWPAVRPKPRAAGEVEPAQREGLDGSMARILDAMAWLEAAGIPAPFDRHQVALVARYSAGAGGFKNALGRLRREGLVSYPTPGQLQLEPPGAALAHAPAGPVTASELQSRVLELVDGSMARCLRPLLDAYPRALTREELADAAGYSAGAGGFKNALGRLRRLGVIDYPDPGHAVARGLLFLEAR